jgi:acyl-CoA thioester hydrolase
LNLEHGRGRVIPVPFRSGPYVVRPEWIDYNGHLNLAYYLVLFDWATDALWEPLGLGEPLRASGFGTFAAESHILYRSELLAGDEVVIDSQILGLDGKRMHGAHEMHRLRDGALASMQELMYLCVDMSTRRVAPWPQAVLPRLQSAAEAHAGYPKPDWVGRRVMTLSADQVPSPAGGRGVG